MKKLLALLLALVMVFSFAACSEESAETEKEEKSETLTEEKKTEDNKTKAPATEESKTEAPATKAPATEESKTEVGTVKNDVVGEWYVFMPMEETFRDVFEDDLDDYLDYSDLMMGGIVFEFEKNGDFVLLADANAAKESFEEIVDLVLDAAEEYLDDQNSSFEEEADMTREEFKESMMEMMDFDGELTEEEGTWELNGDQLNMTMDGDSIDFDIVWDEEGFALLYEDEIVYLCVQ